MGRAVEEAKNGHNIFRVTWGESSKKLGDESHDWVDGFSLRYPEATSTARVQGLNREAGSAPSHYGHKNLATSTDLTPFTI